MVDSLGLLADGFAVALGVENLLAAVAGVLLGTLTGVLPGIGPVAGAALVLPLTFGMDPIAAVIMLAGIYYGAQYGGSTTSVLLNVPGDASAVVAAIDGYPLTQKGRGGAVLTIMALGSFLAGTFAVVLVMLTAPAVSRFATAFGPAEYFALIAGGFLLLTRLTGGSWGSSLLPAATGVVLGTIGLEGVTGATRFTFGIQDLSLGISLVAVAVGLYGMTEMARLVSDTAKPQSVGRVRLTELVPTREELGRAVPAWGRGSVIGFVMGLLPGPSATLSSFLSYRAEKLFSKHKDELGKGAIEGTAGPEASNNAAATSSLIPVLALGLPFSATLALVLAALSIHGITPGPLLMTQHPDLYWGVIASMYIGNVMLLVFNIPMVSVWVSVLRIPRAILVPVIVVIAFLGAYSVNNNAVDIHVLVAMGVMGYIFSLLGFQLAPMLIGVVLGPMIEKHLREGLFLAQGDLGYFVGSPIAVTIWVVVSLALLGSALLLAFRRLWQTQADSIGVP